MSWFSGARAFLSLVPLSLALAGCVQPLYGALGPGVLEAELQAIQIEPIPDRFGYYLEKDLRYAFNGTGAEVRPRYRLEVKIKQKVQAPVVDTVTSRATSATVVADATYTLYDATRTKIITQGWRSAWPVTTALASEYRMSARRATPKYVMRSQSRIKFVPRSQRGWSQITDGAH